METQAKYEMSAPLDIQELTDANIEAMREELLLIPEVPESKEQYIVAKTINISVKKILPRIEERRKEIKAPHLEKCREIDALAKDAVALVQPIIDMSAERRQAWEAEIEAQKEAEREAEQARLAGIMESIECLKTIANSCLDPNLPSDFISSNLESVSAYPVTEELFQEHIETARTIQKNGIVAARIALENRLKFEDEQAELEAQKKAQAEAQAKIEAKQKAEAARLAKIQAEQDKAALEARKAQEEAARKLEEEKAAFEAEKAEHERKAREEMKAEEKRLADKAEAEMIETRDRLWAEALPIHIWEHVYPVALEANRQFNEIRDQRLSAQAKRNMDILRNRNACDAMTRNVLDAIQMAKEGVDMPEVEKLVEAFESMVVGAIKNFNLNLAGVK